MSVNRRVFVAVLFLVALATPLQGQATLDAIAARLKDRPLYVRGFWSDDTLSFDSNGTLSQPSKGDPFALAGFSFRSLKLKDGMLIISGKPVGVEFTAEGPKRVDLPFHKQTIKITAPASGDFGPALDAIFADGIESLAPSLPRYWQTWARKTYPGAYIAAAAAASESDLPPLKKVEGSTSAPQLLQHSEATFNEAAKALKYSGVTRVDFIVEEDGKPTHLEVVKPCGLGLDEDALRSVQSYRFKPAMDDDKPIRVRLSVEVNFQVF